MIQLSNTISLPDRATTMKIGIVGRTGSGKTNTAVVMAEQMISAGVPVVIIDPQGDWWGLRSDYSIAILGGEHADVPLEPTGGAIAADFVVNERVPVLLDLFTMGEGEMVRFATDFAKQLWKTNREAVHVFLDEADLFAPQRSVGVDKAKCLGAWQNVCRRGRSRGLGLTMLSQRCAVINKDLFTQADPLIVHRLTAPQDLRAIDDYLEFHGSSKEERREILQQIAKLKVGHGIVISPGELEIIPTQVKIPKRVSFDSGATPESGQSVKGPKSYADVDFKSLEKSMADTIERAKQNDPKELKKRIKELESELRNQPPAAVDQDEVRNKVNDAVFATNLWWEMEWSKRTKSLKRDLETAREHLDQASRSIASGMGEFLDPEGMQPPAQNTPVAATPQRNGNPTLKRSTGDASPPVKSGDHLQQRILDAIAWWESIGVSSPTRTQVSFIAKARGGYFNNTVGSMRSEGLLDYPEGGRIALTPSGEGAAAYPSTPGTFEELLAAVSTTLNDGLEQRILDAVATHGQITRERLSETVEARGGYFNNTVGKLKSIGVVRYPAKGQVALGEAFQTFMD